MGYLSPTGWKDTVFMNQVLARQVADDVAEMRRVTVHVCALCGARLRWDRDLGECTWVALCTCCGHRQDAKQA